MKTKFLLLMLFFNSILFAQSQWNPMGPNDFGQVSYNNGSSTTLDNNNIPHCVIVEPIFPNKLTVKKFDGTNWVTVGNASFTVGTFSPSTFIREGLVIEFDGNNVPYVAYTDAMNQSKLTVYKLNGTIWELVGAAGLSQGAGSYVSLDFTSTNIPYIAYADSSLSSLGGKIIVKRFNGISWITVGAAGIGPDNPQACCLRFDAMDVPHLGHGGGSNGWVKKFNGFSWIDVGAVPFTGSLQEFRNFMEFGTDNFLYVVRKSPLSVLKFDGTNWITIGSSPILSGSSGVINLALDNLNMPFICSHLPVAGSNGFTKVMKFNGTVWEPVGLDFESFYVPKLQISTDNIPYISLRTSDPVSNSFFRFNGSTWDLLPSRGISFDNANFTSITVNNNNIPHIAYQDVAQAGKATVKKYNGTDWTSVGTIGFSAGQAEFMSIKTKNNVPFVAYKDLASSGKASVQKFNGTNWEYVGNQGFSDGEVFNTALAFGSSNAPYVVYKDVANGNKISVKTFNGTSWINVGFAGFSSGEVFNTSIAVTSSNTVYVTYKDMANGGKITVQGFNGTSWQVLGTAGFSAGEANYTKIAVDSGDIPQVAYQDVSLGYKAFVRRFNGVIWEILGAATGVSSGRADFIDIATDNNNLSYIVYSDATNLKKSTVHKFNGTTWDIIVTTLGFSARQADFCAIVIDNNNIPIVAYKTQNAFAKFFGPANAIVLSIDENNFSDFKISSYPNPVQSTFSISSKNIVEEVSIFDLLGKEVLNLKNISQNINIEFLPKGFYIVQVKTDEATKTLKIIKE